MVCAINSPEGQAIRVKRASLLWQIHWLQKVASGSIARLGDWEADTILSCKKYQAIVMVTERRTLFTLMQKNSRKMGDAQIESLLPYPVLILMVVNGKRIMEHQRMVEALNERVYFVHPNSAREKGTNENANGLFRQCFPKGSDFAKITD